MLKSTRTSHSPRSLPFPYSLSFSPLSFPFSFSFSFPSFPFSFSLPALTKSPLSPLILILVLLFLSSCRPHPITNESPLINEVPAGKQFRINLPEDHSTGYGWQLSQDYDTRLLRHISDVWHGNDKGIDFNFKALSAGQLTLTLVSRKYTDTAATKQFVVKILPN